MRDNSNETSIRLECLKLAHRHDRAPTEVVKTAKIYEVYASRGLEAVEAMQKKDAAELAASKEKQEKNDKKTAGNPDILT